MTNKNDNKTRRETKKAKINYSNSFPIIVSRSHENSFVVRYFTLSSRRTRDSERDAIMLMIEIIKLKSMDNKM